MEYRNKVALGCGGFLLLAAIVAVVSVVFSSRHRTSDPEAVRAISLAICPLVPPEPMVPVFAASGEVATGPSAIWAVDSRFQNLMLVLRSVASEPDSPEALVAALAQVHPSLTGFAPEPGARREPVRVHGVERVALTQTARTVEESRQARVCVSFRAGERWVLLMLQGDPADVNVFELQKLLDRMPPSTRG